MSSEEVKHMKRVKRRIEWLDQRIRNNVPGASFDLGEKNTLIWLVQQAGLEESLNAQFAEDRETGEGL